MANIQGLTLEQYVKFVKENMPDKFPGKSEKEILKILKSKTTNKLTGGAIGRAKPAGKKGKKKNPDAPPMHKRKPKVGKGGAITTVKKSGGKVGCSHNRLY